MAISQAFQEGLESEDPRVRFETVKKIARVKDLDMLLPLMNIAEYDPNKKVREVADRAIHYIAGQPEAADAGPASKPFVTKSLVPEKDKEQARYHLDVAIDYSISNERDKALKELAKALKLNPQLEADSFFHSIRDEVTGMKGEESMAILRDPDQLERFQMDEQERSLREEQDAHLEEVKRSTWASASMDLSIFTFILIFATLFLPIVMSQSANSYIAGQEAAWATYEQEVAEGKGNAQAPDPVDPGFAEFVQAAQAYNLTVGVILALVAGIGGLGGLMLNLVIVHAVARSLFKGEATFPHLIYKVVSFYNGRLPVLYLLAYIGIVATFIMGGGIVPVIVGGIAGLFSLMISLKVIGRVGEAYHFGFLKGFLSMIVASFVVGIIGLIVQMLAFGALAAAFSSALA